MILQTLLAVTLLAHGIEETKALQNKVQALDMRIEALEKQVTINQDKANEIQLEAQPLAVRDWKAYAKQIEEAENYARMALQARNELTRLKKERDKITKIQEEQEKNHQHAPHVA